MTYILVAIIIAILLYVVIGRIRVKQMRRMLEDSTRHHQEHYSSSIEDEINMVFRVQDELSRSNRLGISNVVLDQIKINFLQAITSCRTLNAYADDPKEDVSAIEVFKLLNIKPMSGDKREMGVEEAVMFHNEHYKLKEIA